MIRIVLSVILMAFGAAFAAFLEGQGSLTARSAIIAAMTGSFVSCFGTGTYVILRRRWPDIKAGNEVWWPKDALPVIALGPACLSVSVLLLGALDRVRPLSVLESMAFVGVFLMGLAGIVWSREFRRQFLVLGAAHIAAAACAIALHRGGFPPWAVLAPLSCGAAAYMLFLHERDAPQTVRA